MEETLPTFLLDNAINLTSLAEELRNRGYEVIRHTEVFAFDAKDEDWLPTLKDNDWIVLTKDLRIRTKKLELAALKAAKIGVFVLVGKDAKAPEIVNAITQVLHDIERIAREEARPFVYKITLGGSAEKYDLK